MNLIGSTNSIGCKNLKNKAIAIASLLCALTSSTIALEIPQGEEVYQVNSKSASLEGYAVSSVWNSTNKTYLPLNVISHASYLQEGAEPPITEDIGGILAVQSATYTTEHLEVCYSEQIPVNTSILIWDEGWSSYQLQAVQIPSYRNDRVCIAVPYQNFWMNGVATTSAKFLVFID